MEKVVIELQAQVAEATEQIKELKEQVSKIGETAEAVEKETKSLAKGFKGVGLAMKAAGFNIIMKVVDKLVGSLMENEKVARLVEGAFTAVGVVVERAVEFFTDLLDKAGGIKGIFESLSLETFVNFGKAIKDYVVNYFEQAFAAAGNLAKGLYKLINFDVKGAKEAFEQAGKDMVDAYVGVEEGGVEIVREGLKKTIDAAVQLGEVVKESLDVSYAAQVAAEEAQAASIKAAGEQVKLQSQIEQIRAQRDNELTSLEKKLELNEQIKLLLNEEQALMTSSAEKQLRAAQLQLKIADNAENRLAVLQAETDLEQLKFEYEQQRIDTKNAELEVDKQRLEIGTKNAQTEIEISNMRMAADVEQETNEMRRLHKQRELMVAQHEFASQQLQDRLDALAEAGAIESQIYTDVLNEKRKLDAQYASDYKILTKQIATGEKDTRLGIMNELFEGVKALSTEGSNFSKGIAIAQAIMNTRSAVVSALGAQPWGFWNFAQAAAVLAAGLAQVRQIMQTDPTGQGGQGAAMAAPSMPSVSLMGGGGDPNAQLAETIRGAITQPQRSYVVSSDISSQQSLDRRINRNRTL